MIRAALTPLRSPDPADPVRAAARPIRKLFRAAGPLRECHVHRQLLAVHMAEEELSIPEWIHALTAREMSARQRFLALAPAWTPTVALQLSHRVLSATSTCDEPELEWRARSLFAVLASRLADVQQEGDMSTVDLHHVRRLSKDARYVLGLVTALAPEKDPDPAELDSRLREVHRALGGWHDATVACADLRGFLDARAGARLRHPELYAAYSERLAASAERHRTQFDGAWRRLLSALGVSA
jgi:CHAD domain-containing protein